MSAFWAVAWNGFREARRNRVTSVLAGFAIVLLFSTTLVTEVTVNTFDRIVTDFGLGTMALMLIPLSIYLSCGLIPREIERRTIFLIVTRPFSRASFLVARVVGNMLTLGILALAMSAVFALQLVLTRTAPTQPMAIAVVGLLAELLVITSAGMLFSSMSSQLVSAVITVGLVFAGHLSADLYSVAARSESGAVRAVGKALYYLVPNLERVNFRPMATYKLDVTLAQLGSGLALALAYSTVFLVGATLIFERRDFK
jgi:Cu-processing system permease protein